MARSLCVIEGCELPVSGRGYCHRHYHRLRYWGDPLRHKPPLTAKSRYAQSGRGKGHYKHQRIAADVLGRPLPDGVQIHHVDGNGLNNERRNLVICQSASYHRLLHARARVLAHGGDPNVHAMCCYCKQPKTFDQFSRYLNGPRAGKRAGFCRQCNNAKRAEYYQLHREGAQHATR